MRKLIVPTLGAVLTLTAAGVYAHGQGGRFLQKLDTNNDGKVTEQEFMQGSEDRFKKMDADNDGKITQDELRNYMRERRAERQKEKFKRIDTNNDGKISKDEYTAHQQQRSERHFARMDQDSDGHLSDQEFASGKDRKHHKKHRYGKGDGERRGGGKILKYLDKDGDGVVSKEESMTGWSNWFKKLDVDGDKTITQAELDAYRKSKRSE